MHLQRGAPRALPGRLAGPRERPPFRVVVCHDPQITGIEALATRHPEALISASAGQRTPPELSAAALLMCDSDVVLLTEDHCVPRPDWVRRMLAARAPGRAAVGGRVEIRAPSSAVEWAFYFTEPHGLQRRVRPREA